MSDQLFSHFPHLPPPVGVRLTVLPEQACGYLAQRRSTLRAFAVQTLDPTIYHAFMNAGFRRSGRMIYQPICTGCRACRPIRVPVDAFKPSKSQRRAGRRNQDVQVSVGAPRFSDEKFAIYSAYCTQWHRHEKQESADDLQAFLYDSPVATLEFEYRVQDRLVGVGICDLCEQQSLSSVYFYFDPTASARSLGTFSVLCEIEFARRSTIPHYYLGYWIADCGAMQYKAAFRPAETLDLDGVWRSLPEMGSESP